MKSSVASVLLVITQSEMGGAQRYVLMLAAGMCREGIKPVVVCGEGGELIDELLRRNIEVHVLPDLVRQISPWTDIQATRQLARFIHDRNFDIVHCNSTKAGIVGRIAARIAGVPVVFYTVHGCVLNEPMSRSNFLLYWGLEWVTGLMTSRIIAVSHHDRDTLVRYRVASVDKIEVILNGIDPGSAPKEDGEHHTAEARAILGLPPDATVVGTTANFYKTKALDVLIRSSALITNQRADAHVVIIGDGSERPMLEQLIADLGLLDRVHLPGQIPNARDLLAAFDVFVLPSRKEGLPLALLEAMAAGLPVVVTDVGGMPDAVDHGTAGVVVPREDPDSLARAVESILDDRYLATTLGQAARSRVVTKFSEGRMVSQTLELYRAECHRRSPIPSGLQQERHDE